MRSLLQEYKKMNEKLGLKQYLVPYLMSLPPGFHLERGGGAFGTLRDLGVHAGAGTGFLPDTVDDLYMYVLYRAGSADDGTGLCADEPA